MREEQVVNRDDTLVVVNRSAENFSTRGVVTGSDLASRGELLPCSLPLLRGSDYTFKPFYRTSKRDRVIIEQAETCVALIAQQSSYLTCLMIVINCERLVPFRVQAALTDATLTVLFLIHCKVLLLRHTESSLSCMYDAASLACCVKSSSPVLLIELGLWLLDITFGTSL